MTRLGIPRVCPKLSVFQCVPGVQPPDNTCMEPPKEACCLHGLLSVQGFDLVPIHARS